MHLDQSIQNLSYVAPLGLTLRVAESSYVGFHPTLCYFAPLGLSLHKELRSNRVSLLQLMSDYTIINVKGPPPHEGCLHTRNRAGGGSGFGLRGWRFSLLQGGRAKCDYTRFHLCFGGQTVSPRMAVVVLVAWHGFSPCPNVGRAVCRVCRRDNSARRPSSGSRRDG